MESALSTPLGQLAIRPTGPDDAQRLRDLRLEALRLSPVSFGVTLAEAEARGPESWAEWAARGAGGPLGVVYVADAGGELAGMVALRREDAAAFRHSGWIQAVYVRPAWRGAGVATALIEACAAWGRAEGVRILRLSVVAVNADAIRLYLALGFSIYGVEPEVLLHGGVYYDEILMTRRL